MSDLIFNKKALSAEEQLNLLISRGLIVNDRVSAIELLKSIGYYRLSAYMRTFQDGKDHLFKNSTEFKDVINLYYFDMQLRSICLSAIEKIEIAYRAAITNVMCEKIDSHWFYNKEAFKDNVSIEDDILPLINKEIQKSNKSNEYAETFISKYYQKYSSPQMPPFWMIIETFTMGSLNRLFYNLKRHHKREIIDYIGFKRERDKSFVTDASWLFPLCVVRNICAHHSRLYNRVFRIVPKQYREIKEFNAPANTFYYISLIINLYLKNIANDASFEASLIDLFNKYPDIEKSKLGFPSDWHCFTITYIEKTHLNLHKVYKLI